MSEKQQTVPAFDHIFNADGTCTWWDCGKPGVVLAYDDMAPECAQWFCADHWEPYEVIPILTIVEDKRPVMKKRLVLWPIRLKRRVGWYTFFLRGAVLVGRKDNDVELYGWFVCIGPISIVFGKPARQEGAK